MAVTLLAGLHLTAHDKACIASIVANGWTRGRTPQKAFNLSPMGQGLYAVSVHKDGRTHGMIVICDDMGAPSYETASTLRDTWEEMTHAASVALGDIPGIGSGPMGLTPDAVKFSPEYRRAKEAFEKSAERLRNLTRWIVRTYPKEARAAAQSRRTNNAA